MILTCPNCSTKFRVKDGVIGAAGRKVKCRNCAHTWHAMPTDDGAVSLATAPELTSAPPQPEAMPQPKQAPAPAAEHALDTSRDAPPEPSTGPAMHDGMDVRANSVADARENARENAKAKAIADASADYGMDDGMDAGAPPESIDPPPIPPGIPPGDDFAMKPRTPPRRRTSPLVAWGILLLLIFGVLTGGFFFQKDIVAAYPGMMKVYGLVGIEPQLTGHGLEILQPDTPRIEGRRLIVTGTIVSTLDEGTSLPLLRGELKDTQGAVLHSWTFRAEQEDILPGETVRYATEVEEIKDGVTSMDIRFEAAPERISDEG